MTFPNLLICASAGLPHLKFSSQKFNITAPIPDLSPKGVSDELSGTNAALKAKTIRFVNKIESAQKEAEINYLKNVELKNVNRKILEQNTALQETIDELTKTKISRKAILPFPDLLICAGNVLKLITTTNKHCN